jgi:hypothetical protein
MSNNKWIVKNRDFELEGVKYNAKLTPINKEENPLIAEGDIKMLVKKKFVKRKF